MVVLHAHSMQYSSTSHVDDAGQVSATMGIPRNRHSRLPPSMSNGNRYLLVQVVRAGKSVLGYPLAPTGSLEVRRKLEKLVLTIGVPQANRRDGGGEFTVQVVGQLCRQLNVALTRGPAELARSQGAPEQMVGWVQEVLSILCQKWPPRWNQYVFPVCWIKRVTAESALPSNTIPLRILIGRGARTQIDTMTLSLGAAEFRGGLDSFVAENAKRSWA